MPTPWPVLDLFSGIGGFSLGLERTGGFKTIAFCETDAYCRRVLAKHWSHVPIYDDIRTLTAARLRADGHVPDVLCGGFPCQDISIAGAGAGIEGERSSLWKEFHRLIREVRPQYALVENVPALRSRGLHVVLADLAEIGYDAEWDCIPAYFDPVCSPQIRERIWLLAYPASIGRERAGSLWPAQQNVIQGLDQRTVRAWSDEPSMVGVAYGIPNRVDRLRGLGNAVVPQVVEMLGRAVLERHTLSP